MYLRMTFWTPALAYAGFLLAGGENMPNQMGMMVTTGFMGALLGFLLAIMFTSGDSAVGAERATTVRAG
jgi:hypothetical protein